MAEEEGVETEPLGAWEKSQGGLVLAEERGPGSVPVCPSL